MTAIMDTAHPIVHPTVEGRTMEFRKILLRLEESFGANNFDSRAAAITLSTDMDPTGTVTTLIGMPSKSFLKKVSNKLGRLHGMQFLKRSRTKREVPTRSGKKCNRGFAYRYSISSQGHSYCKFLRCGPQYRAEREKEKFIDRILIESLRNRLPVDEAPFAEKIYGGLIPSAMTKSVQMRFPERYIDPAFTFLLQKRNRENMELKRMYEREVINRIREQIKDIRRWLDHDKMEEEISAFRKAFEAYKASIGYLDHLQDTAMNPVRGVMRQNALTTAR